MEWAPSPLQLLTSASRSQAAKGQGVLSAEGRVVGTGMQIPFEWVSLLKEAGNVDLCGMSWVFFLFVFVFLYEAK